MAFATDREHGPVIGCELVEPAFGEMHELVEPASGEPLSRAAIAGGVSRPITPFGP